MSNTSYYIAFVNWSKMAFFLQCLYCERWTSLKLRIYFFLNLASCIKQHGRLWVISYIALLLIQIYTEISFKNIFPQISVFNYRSGGEVINTKLTPENYISQAKSQVAWWSFMAALTRQSPEDWRVNRAIRLARNTKLSTLHMRWVSAGGSGSGVAVKLSRIYQLITSVLEWQRAPVSSAVWSIDLRMREVISLTFASSLKKKKS